jgi:large subunit ribosomal protein L17
MRHSRVINHLGRTSSHRKAMLANMAASLIIHKRIATTTAKAKALRTYVEPLITKSKEDSTHSRRVVFSYLKDKEAVAELFREISPKVSERPGGYTRILKTGNRIGDNADMCILELVDYNEAMLGGVEAGKAKSTTRRRRAPKKKEENAAEIKAPKATKVKTEKKEASAEKPEKAHEGSVTEEK